MQNNINNSKSNNKESSRSKNKQNNNSIMHHLNQPQSTYSNTSSIFCSIQSTSIPIPIKKINKFYKYLNLPPKQYQFFDYYEIPISKHKTTSSPYSSESLIKLMHIIEDHKQDFLEIISINTNLSKTNLKQFSITGLLREYSYFNLIEILDELDFIRNELKDRELYEEMLSFIKYLVERVKYLLDKHCQTLIMIAGDCLNFYIRKQVKPSKRYLLQSNNNNNNNNHESMQLQDQMTQYLSQQDYEYKLIIGIDSVTVSFCSSNQFAQNIMQSLLSRIKTKCRSHGMDMDENQWGMNAIEIAEDNIIELEQMPLYFKQLFDKKQSDIFQRVNQANMPECFYSNKIMNHLIKFAQDNFFWIEGAIVSLTNLILQKKQLKNINYDQQYISMKHPLKKDQVLTQSYINLYCQHFQGIPFQYYKNNSSCLYCEQYTIVDESKCYQRNKNIFQNLLAKNYLNPEGKDIIYYFKDKIFHTADQQKFVSYPHFCQFYKTRNYIRDRPEVLMILENEKINLYGKLWGKKKLFYADELIQTPVRGKYCRHLEFYDLQRVYEKYLTKAQNQNEFECFVCTQAIGYDEILYLHEMKVLIDLVRANFYPTIQQIQINTYVQINHGKQRVQICTQLEKGYLKKSYKLPIYQTLLDPLSKSQKYAEKEKKNNSQEEHEFQYTEEFSNFFFGC